ncbi:MAG: hypothetical protein ACRC7Q_07985, partial [Plesiomonas shigelloides]
MLSCISSIFVREQPAYLSLFLSSFSFFLVPSLAFLLAAFRNGLTVVLLSIPMAHNFYSIPASKMRDKTVRQNRSTKQKVLFFY